MQQSNQQPVGMPAPTTKTVLVDKIMVPTIWLSLGVAVGFMLAKKKKVRVS
jgi:hypothetical protein